MGKTQSKSKIIIEKRKFKLKNEHCKEDLQEDGLDDCKDEDDIDDCHGEDNTDECREEDDTDDSCNKRDESSHFYGTHETQESVGGEADLHKHFVSCMKNPGHTNFVPVNDFNINHLPNGYHDNDLVEYIKASADLTVRVAVKKTSGSRPQFWQNTNQPYPFYDKRGSDVMKLGSGMVSSVIKLTEEDIKEYKNRYNKETCPCHKCQNSETPSKVWGLVMMSTATHVVFDEFEARHTTCRFFYDREECPLVILDGWMVLEANIEEDRCVMGCVTCDVYFLDKLYKMVGHWIDQWKKVTENYKSSKDKDKLTFIVSHPHGCPKQISVGHWLNRYLVDSHKTIFTYTTCTCPGSSGTNVYSLGYDGVSYSDRHVHSGVNSRGINFSGAGRDFSLYQ